jgi:hypothetical protein
MSLNFLKFLGIALVPKAGSSVTAKGEIAYNATTDKFEVYDGIVDPLVTEGKTQTLANKTLNGNLATNLQGSVGANTFPAGPDTLVGQTTAATLSNKTLQAATFSGISTFPSGSSFDASGNLVLGGNFTASGNSHNFGSVAASQSGVAVTSGNGSANQAPYLNLSRAGIATANWFMAIGGNNTNDLMFGVSPGALTDVGLAGVSKFSITGAGNAILAGNLSLSTAGSAINFKPASGFATIAASGTNLQFFNGSGNQTVLTLDTNQNATFAQKAGIGITPNTSSSNLTVYSSSTYGTLLTTDSTLGTAYGAVFRGAGITGLGALGELGVLDNNIYTKHIEFSYAANPSGVNFYTATTAGSPNLSMALSNAKNLTLFGQQVSLQPGSTGTVAGFIFTLDGSVGNFGGVDFDYNNRTTKGTRLFTEAGYGLPVTVDASGYFAVSTASTERMRITSGGQVGVGSTPTSTYKFYVIDTSLTATSAIGSSNIAGVFSNGAGADCTFKLGDNSGASVALTANNSNFYLRTNGTTAISVDTSQNVIIGNATAGLTKLDITADFNTRKSDNVQTGTVNSLSISNASFVRITGAITTLNGIAAGSGLFDGKRLVVANASGGSITITHNNASASANDRIRCPGSASFTLLDQAAVEFIYDFGTGAWRTIKT